MHNQNSKPFVWAAMAKDIPLKVIRRNRRIGFKQNEALHLLDHFLSEPAAQKSRNA